MSYKILWLSPTVSVLLLGASPPMPFTIVDSLVKSVSFWKHNIQTRLRKATQTALLTSSANRSLNSRSIGLSLMNISTLEWTCSLLNKTVWSKHWLILSCLFWEKINRFTRYSFLCFCCKKKELESPLWSINTNIECFSKEPLTFAFESCPPVSPAFYQSGGIKYVWNVSACCNMLQTPLAFVRFAVWKNQWTQRIYYITLSLKSSRLHVWLCLVFALRHCVSSGLCKVKLQC